MTDSDTEVGHALVTGTYRLDLAELAVLLAAAAHRPPTPDEAGTLLARLWSDLARIDRTTAEAALVAALGDGIPWASYDAIDINLNTTTK